jgi:hypothetical protein
VASDYQQDQQLFPYESRPRHNLNLEPSRCPHFRSLRGTSTTISLAAPQRCTPLPPPPPLPYPLSDLLHRSSHLFCSLVPLSIAFSSGVNRNSVNKNNNNTDHQSYQRDGHKAAPSYIPLDAPRVTIPLPSIVYGYRILSAHQRLHRTILRVSRSLSLFATSTTEKQIVFIFILCLDYINQHDTADTASNNTKCRWTKPQ